MDRKKFPRQNDCLVLSNTRRGNKQIKTLEIMKNLTLEYIKDHFRSNGYEPRHSFKGLKIACNKLAKETKIKATDLLHLLIENRPIEGAYTHSYGFHTANGRELIETLQNYYYQAIR